MSLVSNPLATTVDIKPIFNNLELRYNFLTSQIESVEKEYSPQIEKIDIEVATIDANYETYTDSERIQFLKIKEDIIKRRDILKNLKDKLLKIYGDIRDGIKRIIVSIYNAIEQLLSSIFRLIQASEPLIVSFASIPATVSISQTFSNLVTSVVNKFFNPISDGFQQVKPFISKHRT